MKTIFRKSFVKDLKRHANNKELLARVQEIILEVEAAESMTTIKNQKRLKAEVAYYRIRVGAHRIGLYIEAETVTFVRVLHRREIYRHFP